jgi:dihydrofolate synthase/folylpolyglutamate synthase
MNYRDAWLFLDSLQFFKIKLGLESMRRFLQKLGNPHESLKYIHIAGTNGKGSVGAALVEMLSAAGFRVGWYTSPHLSSVRERFKINTQFISEEAFAEKASRITAILDGKQITYFEFTTALAFLWFAEEKVDYVVLEVGMGGRLDATNVVTPQLSVITNVAMDHEAYLGTTLQMVAAEKAGIIKENVPVVSAVEDEEGRKVIESVCKKNNARLFLLGRDFQLLEEASGFCYHGFRGPGSVMNGLHFSLAGVHQRKNMAVALAAFEALMGDAFDADSMRQLVAKAMRQVRWPGRLEYFELDPAARNLKRHGGEGSCRFLLDGAHNPAGVNSLCQALLTEFSFEKLLWVWGAMQDKDIAGSLAQISVRASHIFLTRPKGERSAVPESMVRLLPPAVKDNVHCYDNTREALEAAVAFAGPDDLICIAGSLYLVGEARSLLIGELVN